MCPIFYSLDVIANSEHTMNQPWPLFVADVKSTYERVTAPKIPSPPHTPKPRRTQAEIERDRRERGQERDHREKLKNKEIPPYFESELGRAFLISNSAGKQALHDHVKVNHIQDHVKVIPGLRSDQWMSRLCLCNQIKDVEILRLLASYLNFTISSQSIHIVLWSHWFHNSNHKESTNIVAYQYLLVLPSELFALCSFRFCWYNQLDWPDLLWCCVVESATEHVKKLTVSQSQPGNLLFSVALL